MPRLRRAAVPTCRNWFDERAHVSGRFQRCDHVRSTQLTARLIELSGAYCTVAIGREGNTEAEVVDDARGRAVVVQDRVAEHLLYQGMRRRRRKR